LSAQWILRATILLSVFAVSNSTNAADWAYSGEHGPSNWGKLQRDYATCDTGKQQSPINVVETKKQKLPPIEFQYRATPLRIVNDGHTVRVRFSNGSKMLIGKDRFTLQQMHFHIPGGDQIQGEEFAMAMHFLHKSSTGGLAAVVVLFREGAEHTALAKLLANMPTHKSSEQLLAKITTDATQFLPVEHSYYSYAGSLTAPPCTEGVTWLVLKQPLTLSAEQLGRLRTFFPLNARPVQPRHARVVKESL
jgi:carbonic anhydrase